MRKFFNLIAFGAALFCLTSCATVFGGEVGPCQRTPPAPGQALRKVRTGALIADIVLFPPGILIDFMTCAIFKPCGDDVKKTDKVQ